MKEALVDFSSSRSPSYKFCSIQVGQEIGWGLGKKLKLF